MSLLCVGQESFLMYAEVLLITGKAGTENFLINSSTTPSENTHREPGQRCGSKERIETMHSDVNQPKGERFTS